MLSVALGSRQVLERRHVVNRCFICPFRHFEGDGAFVRCFAILSRHEEGVGGGRHRCGILCIAMLVKVELLGFLSPRRMHEIIIELRLCRILRP